LELSPTEDLFVIGSGTVIRIDEILESFIRLSGKNISTEIDNSLLRGIDPPRLCSDPNRAAKILDWQPSISISSTLKEIFDEASIRHVSINPSNQN
jgi:nucleoside-diphosphate-sugar epimerase